MNRVLNQMPDKRREGVEAREPLTIGGQERKSVAEVVGDEVVGFLEVGDAKTTLHQADGEDFGVGEDGRSVGRATPRAQRGVGFEIVVYENVQAGHLVGYTLRYTWHGRPSFARRSGFGDFILRNKRTTDLNFNSRLGFSYSLISDLF